MADTVAVVVADAATATAAGATSEGSGTEEKRRPEDEDERPEALFADSAEIAKDDKDLTTHETISEETDKLLNGDTVNG
ncbi:PREDICTED: uncharacterized protein LOC105366171 isoform X3 [Ceratosolen solmsi marchali]|uniref:Uncharacterized protein LOC105366171 isoform X3 n=1 Tax=Ceratosolen solmsi marchali TaxID=326594 RepID=A0AAJ6YR89_9HYME|nr:PREDICTED: uncharacterized protein LOC105366171 isoform X3 [Ceratosolen solmsi marchali]